MRPAIRRLPFDFHVPFPTASAGAHRSEYRATQVVFSQGDPAKTVMYLQKGVVKLSVVSPSGQEAVLAILGSGDWFGEACLAGQSVRVETATAVTPTVLLVIEMNEMLRVLHKEHECSDHFIAYILARNIRVEEDLIDQLFNSSEKRLARVLLLLARYGERGQHNKMLLKISQKTLAEMVGTTRSRINFFMNKFRKLGFIDYNGEIRINRSLLSVVLHD
jgi:CRP/FNR family transcriptional regulator, cyclic AMP receptor protein